MALRFADSFGRYGPVGNEGFLTDYWTAGGGTKHLVTGDTTRGNFLGLGIELVSGFLNEGTLSKTLTHKGGWTIGARIYFGDANGSIQPAVLFTGYHAGTSLIDCQLQADGTFSIALGSNVAPGSGPSGGTSTFSVHSGRKYYVEFQVTAIGGGVNMAISAAIKVNGVQIASGTVTTGINVLSLLLQTPTINRWSIAGPSGTSSHIFSDLYIVDSDASYTINGTARATTLTGFLGDIKIQPIFPAVDATPLQWTPSTAGSHFNKLNEVPPDEDTTYVSDATAGQQDLYNWQPVPSFTGTIPGIVLSIRARKDDEGTKQFAHIVGSQQGDTFSVGDEYIYWHQAHDVDPDTNATWTVAGFNAKNIGVILVS